MRYKCFCKATNREKSEPRYSHNWIAARRAFLKVFDDRIECGDWTIPYDKMERVHRYRTRSMFIPGSVLQVIANNTNYQFGFYPWADPIKHMPVEYTESDVNLGFSGFSLAIRVLALLVLGYFIWTRWF